MAENTKIQWAHHTFNPWRGCAKVSAGCANCYAETMSKRNPLTLGVWGPNGTRVVAAEAAWREPLKWDRLAAQAGERHRVFCASLADVFEDWRGLMVDAKGVKLWKNWHSEKIKASTEQPNPLYSPLTMQDVRQRLFDLIDWTQNLDWLLLTKRPENVPAMMPPRFAWIETGVKIWQLESPVGSRRFCGIVWGDTDNPRFAVPGGYTVCHHDGRIEERGEGGLPTVAECKAEVEKRFGAARPNVWIGTSVEDQATADERIPHLLRVPAKVRFLSVEPLLGPVNLTPWLVPWLWPNIPKTRVEQGGVDWVIAGGESGHHARPCRIEWIRDIVRHCKTAGLAGVPVFVKQLGSKPQMTWREFCEWKNNPPAVDCHPGTLDTIRLRDPKGGDPLEWPADLRVREVPRPA